MLGGRGTEAEILQIDGEAFGARLDPVLNEIDMVDDDALRVVSVHEGGLCPGPVGEALTLHIDARAGADYFVFVEAEQPVKVGECRERSIDVDCAQLRGQFDHLHGEAGAAEGALQAERAEPACGVTADDDDTRDGPAHA